MSIVVGISGADEKTPSVIAMAALIKSAGQEALIICKHKSRSPTKDAKFIDAFIMMGNDFDISPQSYIHRYPDGDPRAQVHPETKCELTTPASAARAKYEETLLRMALKSKMPVLGICGGMQRINVALGGTLHQHVPDMVGHDRLMQSKQGICPKTAVVPIVIPRDTKLAIIARDIKMTFIKQDASCPIVVMENSLHHQSIDMLGRGLRVCSMSDVVRKGDGTTDYLIKGVEPDPLGPYAGQFLLGVQWHPEFGASQLGSCITEHLVQAAQDYAKLKA